MPDYVRVRIDGTGKEKTVGRDYAESIEGVTILDEPAVDINGRVLPMTRAGGRRNKPKTTVKKAAAKKSAAKKAAASKAAEPPARTAETPEEAS